MVDFYKILEIEPDCEEESIKEAFYSKLTALKSNKELTKEEYQNQLLLLKVISSCLLNPIERLAYDKDLYNSYGSYEEVAITKTRAEGDTRFFNFTNEDYESYLVYQMKRLKGEIE